MIKKKATHLFNEEKRFLCSFNERLFFFKWMLIEKKKLNDIKSVDCMKKELVMSSLITVLIVIGFFGASVFIGMNNINYGMYDKKITESEIITDFSTYESAINAYKKIINVYPSNSNWEQELLSIKMIIPENRGEYRYSFTPNSTNKDLEWVGICYSDSIESFMFENIESIHEKGMTVLATNCFETNDKEINKSEKIISFSLTKWIKADWDYVNKSENSGVIPILPPEEHSGKDSEDFNPITPEEPEEPDVKPPIDGNLPLTPDVVYHEPKPTDAGSKFIAIDENYLNNVESMSIQRVLFTTDVKKRCF